MKVWIITHESGGSSFVLGVFDTFPNAVVGYRLATKLKPHMIDDLLMDANIEDKVLVAEIPNEKWTLQPFVLNQLRVIDASSYPV